jgi:hypothetical protein
MWLKWFPWRFIIRYLARTHGFVDPLALLAKLRRFAKPAEIAEPMELLRAGMVFHARGLINSRVIQHNLDWIWPYWIVRQFDPYDPSFIPRAFSLTHVNLTHRNWTALGWPDFGEYPIVDPRGLLTPLYDGWSLDAWIVSEGDWLVPSRSLSSKQRLELEPIPSVITVTQKEGFKLTTQASVELEAGQPVLVFSLSASSPCPAWAVLALRPYNPEGISFVHRIELAQNRRSWKVDETAVVEFDAPVERQAVSDYHHGDVALELLKRGEESRVRCEVGMATAAAMFRLEPGENRKITAKMRLASNSLSLREHAWREERSTCRLEIPNPHFKFLYDAALTTLILHTPGEVYPGPYTYRRFWFRDAAFILHALVCAGLVERAERALDRFPERQTVSGYFHSQAGEWDANGEVLWIFARFCELTGRPPKPKWHEAILRGARWILAKRLPEDGSEHAGLLPAGFSAEHLGPNDYYYWDDFWGIAGLKAAAALAQAFAPDSARAFAQGAEDFQRAVAASLKRAASRLGRPAMPAAPTRRLDAGAIGCLVAGYPLQLYPPRDPRLLDTVEFLLERCLVKGGFFQDMIHSGINPYLTLHLAQVLLRAGDKRCLDLVDTVAQLASATGQWPEAIHPHTLGGCMGDGQHVWAAAEWLLMMRNSFLREEGDALILASGIPKRWLETGQQLHFGPALTRFGTVSLSLEAKADRVQLCWQADWRQNPPKLFVHLPGQQPVAVPEQGEVSLCIS